MVWTEEMRKKALETRQAKKKRTGENHTVSLDARKHEREEIHINVDWEHLPMIEAQAAYAELKKEFERAGAILNARSMPVPGSYVCFICKKSHLGEPRGKDYSYISKETGLMEPILICGELCWIRYQEFRIAERKEREMPRSA